MDQSGYIDCLDTSIPYDRYRNSQDFRLTELFLELVTGVRELSEFDDDQIEMIVEGWKRFREYKFKTPEQIALIELAAIRIGLL